MRLAFLSLVLFLLGHPSARSQPTPQQVAPFVARVRDRRLNVAYDFPAHGVTIDDEVTFERTAPEPGPALLRLSSDMAVDRITRAGKPFAVEKVPGVMAFVTPDEKTFTLSLSYHG